MRVFWKISAAFAAILGIFCVNAAAQRHALDPAARYHRVIALVHLTGTGKASDPIRPEYAPAPTAVLSRNGIVAWSMQTTDDGKMAIVQLVAVDRHAFDALFADKRPEIKVFEIGIDTEPAIEAVLKVLKADFNLAQFMVLAQ
jgi:hypothetical protein